MPGTATSRRSASRRRAAAALLATLATSSCARVDPDRARLCRIALVALEPPGSRIAVLRAAPAEDGVALDYRATGPDAAATLHAATCRFALGRREDLVALVRDGRDIPGATVYLLNRYFVDTPEGRSADPGGEP